MSANKKKSVLDQLIDAGSDSDSEDDQQVGSGAAADAGKQAESAGSGSDGEEETAAAKRAKKAAISLEDLQRAGYNSGPSVLLMKAPQEQQEQQWNWSSGREAKQSEPEQESWQERQQTHYAATEGTSQTGLLAVKAAEQAEKLREARRLEKEQQMKEQRLSFNQKEKRKRDQGQASRGKNYVEEEKRIGRSLEKLLEVTEKIYRAYNPARVTLDTHADEALAGMHIHNQHDETFIRQVLYGVVRYRQFLGSLMDSFYYYNSGVANRDDRDMYKVLAYLTIFRMEELGFGNFRRLVDAKQPQKVVVFYRYLFDERYLKEAVRDDWLKLYDKEFVDETISRLLSWKGEMNKLLDSLSEMVYLTRKSDDAEAGPSSQVNATGVRSRSTVPEPFNLSQPLPKPLPVEDPPPPPIRSKPAPRPRDGPTKEELAIQAAKEANRKAAEEKLARAAPFKLRISERPTNLDRIRQEIEADMARALTFRPEPARPVPAPSQAPVKLNMAAILREDALYRKKQQQEAEMLKKYEAELRDASEFKQWQSSMLQLDEAGRAAAVEKRRQEMGEAQEAAIRARQNKVEENLTIGRQVKAESKQIEEALAREREEAVRQKQALREAVQEGRGAAAAAAERLAAEKRLQAEEERQKQAADAKALAEQNIRELAEKRDIIMQLRALEKVPRPRVKELDPTDTPGDFGLLDTMSLMELRERLRVAKRRRQEEEEAQRAAILQKKQDKEAELMARVSNIQRMRKVAAAQGQARREQRVDSIAQAAATKAAKHEDDVLQLNERLEVKRAAAAAEKARIASEEKKIRFELMQQAAGAAAVEENKFRELRSGAQRELVQRQTAKLQSATLTENTKAKSQAVRMKNVKTELKGKQAFLAAYDEKVAMLHSQAQQEADSDFTRRRAMAESTRGFEQALRTKHEQQLAQSQRSSHQTMQSKLQALAQGLEL